jgi:hypothetical protein
MDEQAKINKDTATKFKSIDKVSHPEISQFQDVNRMKIK